MKIIDIIYVTFGGAEILKKMRRNFCHLIKLIVLCIATVLITAFIYKTFHFVFTDDFYNSDNHRNNNNKKLAIGIGSFAGRLHAAVDGQRFNQILQNDNHPRMGAFFEGGEKNSNNIKIDWHDYEFIELERKREGIGEHGLAAYVPDTMAKKKKKLYDQNGFNGLLSDMIALNRSVADIRHKDCAKEKHLSELPTVSVVVPFYNEHPSALLRTCYSVLNRSPSELIKEIILVDDFSNRKDVKDEFDLYVEKHLPKVKIVRLRERSGLILARIAGAKVATSDVLIFLDSHCEANTNWLPPLLEPIALNYRVCVCPFIDVIAHDTFQYRAQDEGARGAFDWQFYYKRLPRLPEDADHPIRPFKSPVMAGGLFAISAKFFWELGGYDEGLDIWGGEQYELSFKIWQCGGEMLDAPCSRIGHVYRGPRVSTEPARTTDYVHKNYKRVAEVWMDEYKEFLYKRDPHLYASIDAGDLSKQLAIRQNLQCKSFKWFMEEIAFDLPIKYPPIEPPDFAYGAIQSVSHPNLCIDSMGKQHGSPGLYACATDLEHPQGTQYFSLSFHKDIRLRGTMRCFDVPASKDILFYDCHLQQGNQGWRYFTGNKQLMVGNNNRCLDMDPIKRKIFISHCDENNKNQKWNWGFTNQTALNNWSKFGAKDL